MKPGFHVRIITDYSINFFSGHHRFQQCMNFKIQDGKIVTNLAQENRCIKDVPSIL